MTVQESDLREKLLILYGFSIEEQQEDFERAYRTQKSLLDAVPGHINEILVRSTTHPLSYLIISLWYKQDFSRWLHSAEHDAMVDLLKRFDRKQVSVSRYIVKDSFDQVELQKPPGPA